MKLTIPITPILLSLCLFTLHAAQAQTNVVLNSDAGAGRTHLFNALNYGAVGDDQTDNTAAFSKCLAALVAAGGGRMYLPDGVYRGRIKIPPVSKATPSWITVEITGESEPAPVFGTIGNFPLQNHGTIVKCLETSGPAVISAVTSPKDMYLHFSGVYMVLRNLDVRTYDNPAISGIDLAYAVQCRLENVFINTGIYNVQASKPTHGTKGLVTPIVNNAALTILRNVTVTGYPAGIVVSEHTDGDSINLDSNINGLEFAASYHASRFGRVCAQRCTHAINAHSWPSPTLTPTPLPTADLGETWVGQFSRRFPGLIGTTTSSCYPGKFLVGFWRVSVAFRLRFA